MDNETKGMLMEFVSEGFDALDTNEPLIDHLNQENNLEQVNAIFRVFHTLKGLSGFFEMRVMNKLTHNAETLLDLIRKQNKPQDEAVISVIYQTFDILRNLLQVISTDMSDISGEEDADNMIMIINEMMNEVGEGSHSVVDPFDELFDDAEMAIDLGENEIENAKEVQNENLELVQDDLDMSAFISDEMVEQYLTSAFELIELTENNLLILEKEPDNEAIIAETFGAVHSIKGNSGFMAFTQIEELSADIETILDSVRNKELEIDQNIVTILLSNVEGIKKRLDTIKQNKLDGKPKSRLTEEISNVPEEAIKVAEVAPQNAKENPKKTSPKIEEVQPINFEEIDDIADLEEMNIAQKAKPKQTELKSAESIKQIAQKTAPMQRTDIRVETSKIDKLFDLVGELITIESMVTNSPDIKDLDLPVFSKSASMLNKITRELQEISMSIRMMPIDSLFNKMKRLVRDVSIKMKKKIELEISGQDTEMDKNVIDEIADPLVHILRNAIDHGVENPEKRLEAGKSETGHISLRAKYEGNEILIVIQDDGNGIDRTAVLSKALEKGLVSGAVEKLSDKEVFHLIFEPGFSTAKQVTDISGRGVGMDVVKKNIEKLRGSIDISSQLGKGSVFTLRIPLTLAIMEAMLIRIGDSIFALPILSLRESFRATPNMITVTMDGLEVVKIRQEVLPVIRLHEILQREPINHNLEEGILIIIESRDKRVCLFADEIVGQQQAVIKGLSDYIGKVPGITGCMILGDGSIGLILDIESLIQMAESPMYIN